MEAHKTYFSIIIPTFNRAQLILHTIRSVLEQKDILLEVIIVDDGSVDNTAEVLRGFNDDRLKYIKTINRERGAARNSGLQISRGTYVNYFDSDDDLSPCLSDLYQFIISNNSPNVIYGSIENISEEEKSIGIVNPAYSSLKKSILHNNFLACGSVFVKREIAVKFLFSEDRRLSGTEDWELWLRLYSSYDFTKYPKVIFKQRHHAQRSLQSASVERVTEREHIFIQHIQSHQHILLNRFSKPEINLLIGDRFTLIALSQVEAGFAIVAAKYLSKSLTSSLLVTTRKRFWAVLKKLMLSIL